MHPAKSIIAFTTLSGAGYGLLFLLGLGSALGLLPAAPWFGALGLGLGLLLVAAGLLCSTLHLGHPERAWRAVSQWRSSWLSREGLLALATFLPAAALAWGWVIEGQPWLAAAIPLVLLAVATVFCTAMIYASLKTIRQWNHPLVPLLYLLYALATGGCLLVLLLIAWGEAAHEFGFVAALAVTAAWVLKLRYWRDIDGGRSIATPESATGLGTLGKVRLLEPPHTEENYLLREMGYQVARKHAGKLRRIAAVAGLLLPLAALILLLATVSGWWDLPLALVAALGALLGTLTERWLFFAEATHTVVLYYGRQA